MFDRLINAVLMILSTIPLNKNIFDIHLAVITGITLLFSIISEEIVSLIILVFGILYSLTFTSVGITFIPIIVLIFLSKRKNINKIIITILYFTLTSTSHNTLTPILAVAYVLWNHSNKPNTGIRKISFALLIILLLSPLPEFTLKIPRIYNYNQSEQTTQTTSDYNKTQSYQTQQQTKKLNIYANQNNSIQTTGQETKETLNVQDTLLKINQILIITFLIIGLTTYIANLKFLDKVDRIRLFKSFAMTFILISIFSSVILPNIITKFMKYSERYEKQIEKTEGGENQLTTDKQNTNQINNPNLFSNKTNSNGNSQSGLIDKTLTILQLIAITSSALAILFILNELYKILTKQSQDSEGEERKTEIEPTQFTTYYTYDEILKLDKEEFIEHAYLYVRKTFFPEYDYLTPYELLELNNIDGKDELRTFTDEYIKLKYAMKKLDFPNIPNLKEKLVKLCDDLGIHQKSSNYNLRLSANNSEI